ncbi:MAG: phenylalanine--tRNA ligase subunit beta, partial [Sandaracinaceae bacterium]
FTADDLLICDGGGPVAVAGVMGGADSEIRAETRDVLIEVAYFDPRSIRRTSRRLGLHTDSSHRFERGVDPNAVPWAMRRAVTLLCTLAGGAAVPNVRDAYPEPIRARSIELAPTRVGAFLGVAVEEAKVRDHLEAVGCSISPALDGGWRVSAPTHRPDLGRPEDLIEEVARAMGYDAIPTELPRLKPSGRGAAEHLRAARRLREAAAATGLLEAVNYSFVSKADLAHARVPTDGVELLNPLSEERSVMRTSLLPGMLAALARALRHQARSAALFELARVFERAPGERLPKERYELGIALAGERVEHVGAQGDYDYFDVKGALSSVLEAAFGLAMETRPPTSVDPSLHPRRSADVYLVGLDAPVGQVGEVHPDITEGLGMDRRAMFARVALEPLLAAIRARGDAKSSGLPRFPSSSRDVALRVPRAMPAADVEAALRASGEPLMERVELFDVYEGAALEGDKSLAYRIIYRDPDATLTDRRVEEAHRRVVGAATAALGVSVRA